MLAGRHADGAWRSAPKSLSHEQATSSEIASDTAEPAPKGVPAGLARGKPVNHSSGPSKKPHARMKAEVKTAIRSDEPDGAPVEAQHPEAEPATDNAEMKGKAEVTSNDDDTDAPIESVLADGASAGVSLFEDPGASLQMLKEIDEVGGPTLDPNAKSETLSGKPKVIWLMIALQVAALLGVCPLVCYMAYTKYYTSDVEAESPEADGEGPELDGAAGIKAVIRNPLLGGRM